MLDHVRLSMQVVKSAAGHHEARAWLSDAGASAPLAFPWKLS
ncbi:MAG: hypothetical protein ACP5UU_03575 [Thermoprotei archaeon]